MQTLLLFWSNVPPEMHSLQEQGQKYMKLSDSNISIYLKYFDLTIFQLEEEEEMTSTTNDGKCLKCLS